MSPDLPVSLSEIGLRLGVALWWFWHVRGYSSEGHRRLDRILDFGLPILDLEESDQSKIQNRQSKIARALHAAGYLALFQGDFVPARARLGASVEIWRELAALASEERLAQQGLVAALNFLFLTAQFEGDIAARAPLRAEYRALSATLDDPLVRAMLLFNEGRGALLQEGNDTEARGQLEQSLALFRSLGDPWFIAHVVIDLGLVALFQQDYGAAGGLPRPPGFGARQKPCMTGKVRRYGRQIAANTRATRRSPAPNSTRPAGMPHGRKDGRTRWRSNRR